MARVKSKVKVAKIGVVKLTLTPEEASQFAAVLMGAFTWSKYPAVEDLMADLYDGIEYVANSGACD